MFRVDVSPLRPRQGVTIVTMNQLHSAQHAIELAQKGISLSWLGAIITLPASILLYLILGRMGPNVLGYYALVTLLVGLLMTFGFFGDSLVYVRFIPEISTDRKVPFVLSHSLIVLVQGGVVVSCFVLFPKSFHVLLGAQAGAKLALFALLLGPIVWAQGVCSSILQAVIDTSWQSFALKVPILVFLMIAFVLTASIPAWFTENYRAAILILALTANAIGLAVLVRRSWISFFAQIPFGWRFYLPRDFWKFSIPLQLSTLGTFAFQNLDQLLTAHSFSLAMLGQYKAILSFGELVRLAPVAVATTAYPLLVHLRKSATEQRRMDYTRGISDLVFMVSASTSVICILFGPELLNLLFGAKYSQVGLPLGILSLGYCLTGVPLLATAVLISRGRSDLVLIASLIASVAQAALSLVLIPSLGLIGVAVGRVLSICVQGGLTCYWARTGSKLIPGVNLLLGTAVICWLPIVTAMGLPFADKIVVAGSAEMLLVVILFRVWRECTIQGLAPAMVFAPWRWL